MRDPDAEARERRIRFFGMSWIIIVFGLEVTYIMCDNNPDSTMVVGSMMALLAIGLWCIFQMLDKS